VWAKLTAELSGLGLAVPSPMAIRDLRRRIGIAPVKTPFEVVTGAAGLAAHAGRAHRPVPEDGLRRLPATEGPRHAVGTRLG
jgi:hypothetical protein